MLSSSRVKLVLALSAGLTAMASVALAEPVTFVVKPDQSPARFVATGKPGFLKIRGEGSRVEGAAQLDGNRLSGTFTVALAAFKTGIDLRDEHMHGKYLESAKFPKATLVLEPFEIDPNSEGQEVAFKGKLTLKDVEKPVEGKATVSLAGPAQKVKATLPLRLEDYPIGVPSHLGITVADSLVVEIEIVAEKRLDIAAKP